MPKAAAGIAVVGAHALAFTLLAARCQGTELAVAGNTANTDRARLSDDAPPGPGLHYKKWTVEYRGGFARSVGKAEWVGPSQVYGAEPCSGRVVIGQTLLDQAAPRVRAELDKALRGESVIGAGDYQGITNLSLRWARVEWHPDDRGVVGDAPNGYVRATATIAFQRVNVPVVIALIPPPVPHDGGLHFKVVSHAGLGFDNRVAQWLSDKLGGDRLATYLTRDEISGAIDSILAPPPPLDLPGGGRIAFGYCAASPVILEGTSGAIELTVALTGGAASIRPPLRGPATRAPLAPGAQLAIDLDLDALNAILFDAWQSRLLDRELAAAGLDRAFNDHPLVQELLTLRLSPVSLALPPVIAPTKTGLRISADARVTISDGAARTTGRIWAGADLRFDGAASADLGALDLACEQGADTLVPCYADLVDVIRDQAPAFHDALTEPIQQLLDALFVERHLSASGLPGELVIRKAVPRLTLTGTNASLHLDLIGELH